MKDLYIAYNPKTHQMSEPFHPFSESHIEFSVSVQDSIKICDALTQGLKWFQGTGVMDRTGELIYEGHLVSNNFASEKEVIRVVEYKDGAFVARLVKGKTFLQDEINLEPTYNFAVVGHIRTHSHLIQPVGKES